MRTFRHALITLSLLAGSSLFAGDYDAVLDAIKKGLPGKTSGVVACHIQANRSVVRELAEAAHHRGLKLRFLDVASADQYTAATGGLQAMNLDFAIIVDEDPLLGSQGSKTKAFISSLGSVGVPAAGLDEALIKQGATFVVGPKTQGKVVPNPSKMKSFGVKL